MLKKRWLMNTDLPDVNVLFAALDDEHQHHHLAQEWLSRTTKFATTPLTEAGLVRLAMNPKVGSDSWTFDETRKVLKRIRESSRSTYWTDTPDISTLTIVPIGIIGFRQITDLLLVNLAAEHGGRLVTFDRKIQPSLAPPDRHLVHCLLN
jgi:uncharacterized protein